jgi:hypothetical protein
MIREYIKSLPLGTPERLVTERGLRALVDKPHDEQIRMAGETVRGFKGFLEQRRRTVSTDHTMPRPVASGVVPTS